jgi:hypothetical protein
MGDALKSRLASCCRVLEVIDRRRAATGDPNVGASVERLILDRELRELECVDAQDANAGMRRRTRRR